MIKTATRIYQTLDLGVGMFNQSLIRCRLCDSLTDDQGIATIDWLPVNERQAAFFVRSDRFALRRFETSIRCGSAA